MLLTNPKQQRTLAEIVASIPDAARVEVVMRLARVSRMIEQQQKFDSAVAAALDRIQRPNS
jgi:hypothetical protein